MALLAAVPLVSALLLAVAFPAAFPPAFLVF
jgi:hypothetical protein